MTQAEAFQELEKYIITSISTESTKLININVAKRVITEMMETKTCDGCKESLADGNADPFSNICENCTRRCYDCYEPKVKPTDKAAIG